VLLVDGAVQGVAGGGFFGMMVASIGGLIGSAIYGHRVKAVKRSDKKEEN